MFSRSFYRLAIHCRFGLNMHRYLQEAGTCMIQLSGSPIRNVATESALLVPWTSLHSIHYFHMDRSCISTSPEATDCSFVARSIFQAAFTSAMLGSLHLHRAASRPKERLWDSSPHPKLLRSDLNFQADGIKAVSRVRRIGNRSSL